MERRGRMSLKALSRDGTYSECLLDGIDSFTSLFHAVLLCRMGATPNGTYWIIGRANKTICKYVPRSVTYTKW